MASDMLHVGVAGGKDWTVSGVKVTGGRRTKWGLGVAETRASFW